MAKRRTANPVSTRAAGESTETRHVTPDDVADVSAKADTIPVQELPTPVTVDPEHPTAPKQGESMPRVHAGAGESLGVPPQNEPSATVVQDPPKIPTSAALKTQAATNLRNLAPKVAEGDGGRLIPRYNIRRTAIEKTLAKGVFQGDCSTIREPGKWRVMREQQILMAGHVNLLREGDIVSTQTHDMKYLKRSGLALRPINEEAERLDHEGLDSVPKNAPFVPKLETGGG